MLPGERAEMSSTGVELLDIQRPCTEIGQEPVSRCFFSLPLKFNYEVVFGGEVYVTHVMVASQSLALVSQTYHFSF